MILVKNSAYMLGPNSTRVHKKPKPASVVDLAAVFADKMMSER